MYSKGILPINLINYVTDKNDGMVQSHGQYWKLVRRHVGASEFLDRNDVGGKDVPCIKYRTNGKITK